MKSYADFHVHSTFCDGRSSPEDIVKTAIDRGHYAIGISPHSPMPTEPKWEWRHKWVAEYKAEMTRLKEVYGEKITILTGIELDSYCDVSLEGFDYIISSLHFLKVGDEYLPTDWSAEHIYDAAEKHFGGDVYAYAEEYFRQASSLADIGTVVIGHFDVITKFNEDGKMFDEGGDRYMAAATAAADALLRKGAMFEINTGAIFRGFRTTPYPGTPLMRYLAEKGARMLLTGDAHCIDALCYRFDEAAEIAHSAGVSELERFPQRFTAQ